MTVDDRAFRDALGSFATGVTIATTLDALNEPVGVTASSFNSVSLDPPLVLWSLAKDSFSREAFCSSGHFAVHVLAASQEELSNRFARSGDDKFSGVEWTRGELGSPVLDQYAARFECRTRHEYEGGDHVILVGEVVSFDARDEVPLLFHGGSYAESRPRAREQRGAPEQSGASLDFEHGSFSDEFLFYLITRAHFQTSRPIRRKLEELGLSMSEYMALAILSVDAPLSGAELAKRLAQAGLAADGSTPEALEARQLVQSRSGKVDLADEGRRLFVETLAFGKAIEADLADHFSAGELAETKRILRRIIDLTGEA